MTSKTQTEQYLRAVALPEQTDSYTVISHGDIIDTVRQMLADNGFTIKEELYKGEANGNIALGFMQLENDLDPDMGMTFNWANSYNKQVKFSCAIGGFIYDNQVPFVSGTNQGKWNRKHTGTALDETKEVIEAMIVSAHDHFAEIIAMKEQFKSIKLSRKEYAKLSGLFFFDKMLISPDQVSVLRKEYDKPHVEYSDKGTLWEYYKMLMLAVVDQSPKTWYKQQSEISNYINILYSISKTPVAVGEVDLEETVVETKTDYDVVEEEAPQTIEFVTDEEEDEVMDSMFTPIEPVIEAMESIDKLIDAQNLIKEPLTRPTETMEEVTEVVEEAAPFVWDTEEIVDTTDEVEEIILPTANMSEEQIELIQEEHGIIETGSPDDGFVGATVQEDDAIEALFELTEDIEEIEEEETPWFTSEEKKEEAVELSKAPALIPDSMREAVEDILENSYQNMRRVVDSKETEDGFIFELDSQEFFHVDK
jgi:hypothetical protein